MYMNDLLCLYTCIVYTFLYRRPITRRATGVKSNRLSTTPIDQPTQIQRSLTTRLKTNSRGSLIDNRLSVLSEDQSGGVNDDQKRFSIASSKNVSHRDSTTYDDDDDRGGDNYEMMDFDFKEKKPVLSTNAPPPSYAPPPAPSKEDHSYLEIDYIKDEDDDDYQPVIPGQGRIPFKGIDHSHTREFADPRDIIPVGKREKSPGADSMSSPPRRNSFIDKLRPRSGSSSRSSQSSVSAPPQPSSPPPSPPGQAHLTPMPFLNKKSPSPALSSDSEPILEDLESIRKRLLQSARDSLISDTTVPTETTPTTSNVKPLIDFSDGPSSTPPNTSSGISKSTTPPQQPQPIIQDDYWDHLTVKRELSETTPTPTPPKPSTPKPATLAPKPGTLTTPGPKPSTPSPTHGLPSDYSLASEWDELITKGLPPVEVSGFNAMYSTVDDAFDGQTKQQLLPESNQHQQRHMQVNYICVCNFNSITVEYPLGLIWEVSLIQNFAEKSFGKVILCPL